jgi:hypothetical protein
MSEHEERIESEGEHIGLSYNTSDWIYINDHTKMDLTFINTVLYIINDMGVRFADLRDCDMRVFSSRSNIWEY